MGTVWLRGERHVSIDDVRRVAYGAHVQVDASVYEMLDQRRRQIVNFIQEKKKPIYGFNRGFGHNVDMPIPENRLADLQHNLILSHACGTGNTASNEIVRAAMFLRALSLSRGHSAVRPLVVRMLIEMLNHKVTPEVPMLGSVGASGDLVSLSHIALALLGYGWVYVGDSEQKQKADQALLSIGLTPLKLEMKEGLALNNGIQFSTAVGILSYFKMKALLKTAVIASALTTQVMLGSDAPFRSDLHELRPHFGAMRVAQWLRKLMADSPIRNAHYAYDIDGEIQDPYNIRCTPQILGACYDLIEDTRTTLEIEANSVTDNPVLLPAKGNSALYTEVVSSGHFHGMPVAVKLYNFMQAMGIMSRLSNMRCVRYIDAHRNKGLGSDLKWPKLADDVYATCSGMMIPEYASASLTNYIWGACMPTHLFSLSTDAGQEDHVSMCAGLAARLWETIPRMSEVLAIELAMAAQAAEIREAKSYIPSKIKLSEKQIQATKATRTAFEDDLYQILGGGNYRAKVEISLEYPMEKSERKLSVSCDKVVRKIQAFFPRLENDRYMSEELNHLAKYVFEGKIADAVEEELILEQFN